MTEHGVDLFGRRPLGRAVFLAVTGAALGGAIQADPYDMYAPVQARMLIRLCSVQRIFKGVCRAAVRFVSSSGRPSPEGLGNQERGPDHGDVEKQIREDPSRSARFIQRHSPPTEKQGRTALVRPIGCLDVCLFA